MKVELLASYDVTGYEPVKDGVYLYKHKETEAGKVIEILYIGNKCKNEYYKNFYISHIHIGDNIAETVPELLVNDEMDLSEIRGRIYEYLYGGNFGNIEDNIELLYEYFSELGKDSIVLEWFYKMLVEIDD